MGSGACTSGRKALGHAIEEDHYRDALILSPDRFTLLFKGFCKFLARKYLCSLNSLPDVVIQ